MAEPESRRFADTFFERVLHRAVGDRAAAEGLIGDIAEDVARRRLSSRHRAVSYRWQLLRYALAYATRRREPSRSLLGSLARGDERARFTGIGPSIRAAARSLREDQGVLAMAVLTLALGVAASTAVYGIVQAVLLRDLPYRDPDQIVFLRADRGRDTGVGVLAEQTLLDVREASDRARWEGIGVESRMPVEADGLRVGLSGAAATPGLFPLLGIDPILGRHFVPEDAVYQGPGEGQRILLSHDTWKRVFSADYRVVGRKVTLGSSFATVIGVLPEDGEVWLGPRTSTSQEVDFWWPYSPRRQAGRFGDTVRVVGRMADGVRIERLQADIDRLDESLQATHPDVYGTTRHRVAALRSDLVHEVRAPLLLLSALVASVLLVAAANSAGLFLARARARELGLTVKMALGAGRRRVVLEALLEAALISALVAAPALAAARGLFALLIGLAPESLPRIELARFDTTVAAIGVVLAVATTLGASLVPVARTLSVSPERVLRGAGTRVGGRQIDDGTRRLLVVFQVGLSVVLLLGAGLLAQSLARLAAVPLGYDAQRVVVAAVEDHELDGWDADSWQRVTEAMFARARQALLVLEELPTVETASLAGQAPLGAWPKEWTGYRGDDPTRPPGRAPRMYVAPGYFRALDVELLEGREFRWDELSASGISAVVITEDIAEELWPGGGAVGRQLTLSSSFGDSAVEVVGVAPRMRTSTLHDAPAPQIYAPSIWTTQELVARIVGDPRAAIADIRRTIEQEVPWLSISSMESLDDRVTRQSAGLRFMAAVVTALAIAGAIITCSGLFALAAFLARTRRQEMRIRMALGAQHAAIVGLGLREATRLVAAGTALGVLAGYGMMQVARSVLFGTDGSSALVFLGAPALIAAMALTAAFVPAWRSARSGVDGLLRSQ